ncbi:hypothetical protein [Tautonia sociabilis]|uniref:SHOCT domain-containing protein n=1 Tax=Tautonia sociabilis TaxID=2080755 RepID=A0A432MS11_9BACT|nr:hypothetical protein [Tautonia sociabilis]RUL89787.1 hypothetical protein TsocGM_01085 [Tautonia sociabilis]
MPELDSKTQELLSAIFLMAGLLVLVALGIQVVSIYRKRLIRRADTPADLSDSFREAFEAGELSEEEYRRIQDAMGRGPRGASPRSVPASGSALPSEAPPSAVEGEKPLGIGPDPVGQGAPPAEEPPRS